MSPTWVLLNRSVDFSFDEEDDSSAAAVTSFEGSKASYIPAKYQATVAMLSSMKPDPVLLQPPGIATFRLRGPASHVRRLGTSPFVACADKGLLVLYSGTYLGPGSFSTTGCYLVYDADADADAPLLYTVPPPRDTICLTGVGSGAVVLRRHTPSSAYLLAELATIPSRRLPDAALLLWRSDEPEWTKKEVQLPREVCTDPGKHIFYADTSFSGPGGYLCWVDLIRGIIVCTNPWGPEDPVFRFIPLPDGCPEVDTSDYPYRPRVEEFRSAACVDGRIKVVAMVGILEGWDSHQFRLTTWTLSPDLSGWREDGVFPLEDIWATQEYRALKVAQHTPVCPVLSAREYGVVYSVVNDVQVTEDEGTKLQFRGQYVLGLDMRCNKIVSTCCSIPVPESLSQLAPNLLATDFCASLQAAKDRQREVEASVVGDGGKRLKV